MIAVLFEVRPGEGYSVLRSDRSDQIVKQGPIEGSRLDGPRVAAPRAL